MILEIVTPEATLLHSEVNLISVPGVNGVFQMLNNHAPIVSLLVKGTVKFAPSTFPIITNVLVHINGAKLTLKDLVTTADIGIDSAAKGFQLAVIDGQHRVNGAYFALMIKKQQEPNTKFEVPAEVFLDLDEAGAEPKRQAQIFIDVNLYQKKVDRSLV
ncbi:MAG: hypothetical protein COC22_02740, partial [Flavobacteriaceae bacterium]